MSKSRSPLALRYKAAALTGALVGLLAGYLTPSPPAARAQGTQAFFRPIVSNHDYDSATVTYALLGPVLDGVARLKTTGSSATVDAANGTPFSALSAPPGPLLIVQPCIGGGCPVVERYVLTRPTDAQVTINVATDWSGNGATGFPFQYRNLAQGTTAADGWWSISNIRDPMLSFQIEQLAVASGSVAVVVECKGSSPWATPIPVYPPTGGVGQCETGLFTTAGATARCQIVIHEQADGQCRFGVSLTDDAGDLTTNLERVTAYLTGLK